jgi:uncharacterized membrane protein YdjX (TVP38/TMEM64 family)
VRARAFAAAMAIGALVRTMPYLLLGRGLATGSAVGLGVAAASITLGGGAAALVTRQMRLA